jgi:hypothetical protein
MAPGADEALADRVHLRSLDCREHDPSARSLEDGIEGGGEVGSVIVDQEPDVLEPITKGDREVAVCRTAQSSVGYAVTPPRCIRRVPCSMNTSTYRRLSSAVSTCRKSAARIPVAWAAQSGTQGTPAAATDDGDGTTRAMQVTAVTHGVCNAVESIG